MPVYLRAVQQIFVRDGEGKVYGPLEPVTVELLIDGGVLNGALLVSTDGVRYGSPARYPQLKDFFPATCGETTARRWPRAAPSRCCAAQRKPARRPPRRPDGPSRPGRAHACLRGSSGAGRCAGAAGPGSARPFHGPANRRGASTGDGAPPGGCGAALEPCPQRQPRPQHRSGFTARPAQDADGQLQHGAARGPPHPSVGTPAVPGGAADARFSSPSPGAARPAGSPTPAGGMPVPPRTTTPRPPPAPSPPGSSYLVASGDLAEISAIRLYAQAAETNLSGLFTFQLSDRSILVHFRKGNPELIESSHPEDAVEVFLSKALVVTAEQLKVAEKEKGRFGGEVLATLFALGLVNQSLVFPALTQRAASLLLRTFLAPAGLFQHQPLELPPSKALPSGTGGASWPRSCAATRSAS